MDKKQRRLSLVFTLVLLGLNLVLFNAVVAGLAGLRVDLTEDGLYSISPATRRILESLEEDLLIAGYFSQRTHPKLAPLVPQIADLLDEYQALSRGRVQVEIIDPGEDELAEQEATDRFGVTSTPFQLASKYETGIVNAYFSIVIKYGDQYVRYGFQDLIQVEPTPDGDDVEARFQNLEYDLTRAIKKVVFGFRSTAELFERVAGPVTLTAIISGDGLPELFQDVPEAVRTAAAELKEKGRDRFTFTEIDPTGNEQLQQELMVRYGARPLSLGLFSEASFYLYGLLEVGGRLEQIPLVGDGVSAAGIREAVENALRRQTPGFLKTVGVVAPGPELPDDPMFAQMQGRMPPQPPPEFEQVKRVLEEEYQIQPLDLYAAVPTDVDVLLVLKPKNLDEQSVYHLDQYLMRGGRVILCAENYEAKFNQTGLQVLPVQTGLDDWLAHHGVQVGKALVLDDRNQPLPIPELRRTPLGTIRTWVMRPYPYLVEVREEGLVNQEITARVDGLGIYWGNPLTVDAEPGGDREVIEILRSSAQSWTSDDLSRVGTVEYTVPDVGTAPQLLAAALNGTFTSFYAEREAPSPVGIDPEAAGEDAPARVALKASPETRLVVVGNAAFLSDFVAQALGRMEGGFFFQNLDFMKNLIDWVNLDNEMLQIRARGGGPRRLDRIERSHEVTLEVVNYLVPALLLLGLGAYRFWRRRHTAATIAAGAPDGEAGP